MTDLTSRAGIPISLEADMRLRFGPELPDVRPAVRTRAQVAAVGYAGAVDGPPDEPLYWMYRAVERPADRAAWEGSGLRYDVTVLRPGVIAGGELVKTVGHYHPAAPGTSLTYPEIYTVLHGRAIYLLQRVDLATSRVLDLALVEAGPGDVVLIPPGYGHITVNAGDGPLVMANCVERSFASIYEPVARARGGAVYLLRGGGPGGGPGDAVRIVPNPAYRDVPAVRVEPAGANPAFALPLDRPLYEAVVADPAAFGFCVRPGERWAA